MRVLVAAGVKVIEIVQVSLAPKVFGDSGQFEVCAKSPEAKIPKIVKAAA